MQLSGNTILITGATSGLGLAFAEAYLHEGSTVIICGRRAERLQQIKEQHPNIITKVCDVADETQRRELHAWATEQYPALNILMNNAGMQLHTDLKQEVHIDNVRQEIETNLVAPIHLSSLFAPHLGQHSEAAIMNISSGLSFVPIAFMPVYCATKAAIHSLTMSLRWQLRKTTIKVFEIAPPSVDTELGHQNRADKNQSHGGIPISEFITEALEGIRADNLETLVGMAKGMNAKRDELFEMINSRFEQ